MSRPLGTFRICRGCSDKPRGAHACEYEFCLCGYVECIKKQTELAKQEATKK